MAIAETAYAKINLYLHVTAIRADGYHELDSLFAFADFGDELALEAAPAFSFRMRSSQDAHPEIENNIIVRAAHALSRADDAKDSCSITLDKSLPIAAGIGGGSADAAATLRGLNKLWGLGLDDTALARIGATLGADVPASVRSVPVHVAGIGDVLTEASPLPPLAIVLVNPGVQVSTPDVFRQFDDTSPALHKPDPLLAWADPSDFMDRLAARTNDLKASAVRLAPVISDVLEEVSAMPGCLLARMSGSGATCFGLFAAREAADDAASRIAAGHIDWWVRAGGLRTGPTSA